MVMAAEFVKVATVSEIQAGSVKICQAAGHNIALCNVNGEFYAIADLCTHDNGPLGEGELIDDQIECPRHGARFEVRTGKPLSLPAVVPVPTYKVEVRGDEIFVGVS